MDKNRGPALLPLSEHVVLETTNFERLASLMNQTPTPHSFDLIGRSPFYSCLKRVDLSISTLRFTTTEGRLRVRVGPGSGRYVVWFDWAGVGRRGVPGRESGGKGGQFVVHSPGDVTEIMTPGYLQDFGVAIEEQAVRQELENQLGRSVNKTVKFEAYMDSRTLCAGLIRRRVTKICRVLDAKRMPLCEAQRRLLETERSLVCLLLSSHRHNYTRLLNRKCGTGPGPIRLAEDFIRAHAELPITMGDLASLTGVSARTLEYGFRRHRDRSPMQFLRQIRFENARADLRNPATTKTVSAVAAQWGFLHFSRFAADYAQLFGELPSATLRKAAQAA